MCGVLCAWKRTGLIVSTFSFVLVLNHPLSLFLVFSMNHVHEQTTFGNEMTLNQGNVSLVLSGLEAHEFINSLTILYKLLLAFMGCGNNA